MMSYQAITDLVVHTIERVRDPLVPERGERAFKWSSAVHTVSSARLPVGG
jgi:hypothetical protein